jgi:hypothetical protein
MRPGSATHQLRPGRRAMRLIARWRLRFAEPSDLWLTLRHQRQDNAPVAKSLLSVLVG